MSSSLRLGQNILDRPTPDDSISQSLSFDLSQAVTVREMEDNADQLMDALFADVELMVERGAKLPSEVPPPAETDVANPVGVPIDSTLPPKLSPRDLIPQHELAYPPESTELSATALSDPPLSDIAQPAESNPTEVKKDNLLWLAVLCSSLLFSAGILSYLFQDQVSQVWLRLLNQTEQPATSTTSPVEPVKKDADFLNYIQQSLEQLARKAGSKSETELATKSSTPTVSASPPSPTVVERVYVPVYPSSQTPTVAPSSAPPQSPNAASSPKANRPAVPVPNVPNVTVPIPNPSTAAVPNITAITHTLIGVLALGERSAALFDVNGTPQRIEIGEQVGSSGWTLVSINNQEAIVRRNGEVRSIYVGQKF